ncbi:MAG: HD-GYP domain-containing protein [Myxococcota bacterium]
MTKIPAKLFERPARILAAIARGPSVVAHVDAAGNVRWASSREGFAALRQLGEHLADGGDLTRVCADHHAVAVEIPAELQSLGWLVLHLSAPIDATENERIHGVLEDVARELSERLELGLEADSLAEELSLRYEELNLLYSMDSHSRTFDGGTAAAQALLENLVSRLEIDLAALVIAERKAPIVAKHPTRATPNLDLLLTAMRGDLYRFAVQGGAPVVLNDEKDPRRQYLLANMPYRMLACPATRSGRDAAMLVVMRQCDQPEFTNGDRNLCAAIASQTAIMIENQGVLGSLQRFGEQIAASLIEAIEAKDPYTRGHSERVQKGSVSLAMAADLHAETVEGVSWGALLHDIGKIGIPDAIICKAGKLDDDEYTMIKTHAERSYEILRHIEYLGEASLRAARHHHERFDGNGYPKGLSGEQIPVEARVVSIADTYDALTSSRSYRAATSHGDAMKVIREAAGNQLDPRLVEVFEQVVASKASEFDLSDG